MKLVLKTKVLLGLTFVLLAVNVVDRQQQTMEELPHIVALAKDDITKIQLTHLGNTIVLEKNIDWQVVSPIQDRGDLARITALILNFRKDISMDALIDTLDESTEKQYGLDPSNSIVVELWGNSISPDISFVLGNDSALGGSFVRLSGSNSVYRANVGGRRRYAYDAGDWVNQQVLGVEASSIQTIAVTSKNQAPYTIYKDSVWMIDGLSGSIEQQRLAQAIDSISVMRIGQRLENQEFPSALTMSITTPERSIDIAVSEAKEGSSMVAVDGTVVSVAAAPFERFMKGAEYFVDTRVFDISSRQSLDMIRYKTDLVEIILQQDLSNGFWKVLQPSNIDLDMREVFFMVNTLVSLSSIHAFVDPTQIDNALLEHPQISIDIRGLQGNIYQLQIFDLYTTSANLQGYLCRVVGTEQLFLADPEDISRITKGFGQSSL